MDDEINESLYEAEDLYIPVSIHSSEFGKTNYFLSPKKLFLMFLSVLALVALIWSLAKLEAGVIMYLIVLGIYLVISFYFYRFIIFEEIDLKKKLSRIEKNRYTDAGYFYNINTIEKEGVNNGKITYSRDKDNQVRSAFIVSFDRSSIVNMPEGTQQAYLQAKTKFLKNVHANNLDVRIYHQKERAEIPIGLRDLERRVAQEDRKYLKMAATLQLNVWRDTLLRAESIYNDFYMLSNRDVNGLTNLKQRVENTLNGTLSESNLIKNPRILKYKEVNKFFADYFMMDTLNIDNIRSRYRNVRTREYADIVSIVDNNNEYIPLDVVNEAIKGSSKNTLTAMLEKDEQQKDEILARMKTEHKNEITRIDRKIRHNSITQNQYNQKKRELDEFYQYENYVQHLEDKKNKAKVEKEERRKKKIREKEEKRRKIEEDKKAKEKKKQPSQWFDTENDFDDIDNFVSIKNKDIEETNELTEETLYSFLDKDEQEYIDKSGEETLSDLLNSDVEEQSNETEEELTLSSLLERNKRN